MSWLSGLASKAEDLLNKVDQSAAGALKNGNDFDGQTLPYHVAPHGKSSATFSSQYIPPTEAALTNGTHRQAGAPANAGTSYGVTAPLRSNPPATTTTTVGLTKSGSSSRLKKNKDDELFEFLNSNEPVTDSKNTNKGTMKPPPTHSRQSSISSTTSNKSSRSNTAASGSVVISMEKTGAADSDRESVDNSMGENHDEAASNHAESSSGYHSNQEDGQSQQMSSLELENKLLKNEVASLNHEVASVIQRAKAAQSELDSVRRQLDQNNANMSQSDQLIRELRSRESDLQEALAAKDSQLGVLRVRYEEAEKGLESKKKLLGELNSEKNRILQDQSSMSGVQSQALESLKEKLAEAEAALRREQDAYKNAQQEAMQRQSKLEAEQQSLAAQLRDTQKKLSEEKARANEMSNQMKSAKTNLDASKQELADYKDKATRILQSKDRLIATLKEGSGMADADAVSSVETEELKQERDILKEELQQSKMTVDNLRAELQDLETQLQNESDTAQEQIRSLEEQLREETRRREDAEQEILKQKQELQYTHEELYKQKTSLQSRLQDREADIEKLRNQLTTKSLSSTSESELEGRLHALTESLIQKQTMIEALSTEKNSLVLQLERMEGQYKEAQSAAIRAMSTHVAVHDDDESRQRIPSFMRESPADNNVARNVKKAYNSIDKFSVRLGVFLRRYPIARVFVIVYMLILHFWVMVVLLTYQPEMHGDGFTHNNLPEPPGKLPG